MTTLAEAVLLLIDHGSTSKFTTIDRNSATVGATLADLALAGRITTDGKHVTVIDTRPTAMPLADEVLAKVATDKLRKPAGWISKLYWGFPSRVRDGLVPQGVLDRQVSKFFHVRSYQPVNNEAETNVRERLQIAVDAGGTNDPWVAALADLVRALRMYKQALPGMPRHKAKAAIAAIAGDSWAGEATQQAVNNNYIAVFAALIPIYVMVASTWIIN